MNHAFAKAEDHELCEHVIRADAEGDFLCNMPENNPVHATQREEASRERVCDKCGTWVYYDNGDVTFHCGCVDNHWKWRDVPAEASRDTQPEEERGECPFCLGTGTWPYRAPGPSLPEEARGIEGISKVSHPESIDGGARKAEMGEWVRTEQRLPADGVEVLFNVPGCRGVEKGRHYDRQWESNRTDPYDNTILWTDDEVDCWMILPEPPKAARSVKHRGL